MRRPSSLTPYCRTTGARVRDRFGGLFAFRPLGEGEAPAEPQPSQCPVRTARREARPPTSPA